MDDIFCIHHDPDNILKPGSVGSLDIHLDNILKQMQLYCGIWVWSMSPSKYVNVAARICRRMLQNTLVRSQIAKESRESIIGYYSELDMYSVSGPDEASYYQSLLGYG